MMIRPARPDDAPALTAVKVASWRKAYGQIFPAEFLDSLAYPSQYWDRHLDGLVVAVNDGRVVGYCSHAAADDEGWGEIRAIYVHPRHQGQGHGSRLLASGISGLRERGFGRALLWVIDGNSQARRFYEVRGFAVGSPFRIEDIGGTQVTLVRYERDISPVVNSASS